ncbi:MAG: hypothetical protein J6328_03410 [Bacilli bacterium]|nr:hypothetical protein [Bacilli bacterium]
MGLQHDGLGVADLSHYDPVAHAAVSKKYDGDLKIKADNGVFSLSILLPDNPKGEE